MDERRIEVLLLDGQMDSFRREVQRRGLKSEHEGGTLWIYRRFAYFERGVDRRYAVRVDARGFTYEVINSGTRRLPLGYYNWN